MIGQLKLTRENHPNKSNFIEDDENSSLFTLPLYDLEILESNLNICNLDT